MMSPSKPVRHRLAAAEVLEDSFFIGYAPADNPKIAFACVVEGAEYSKYMIRDVLKAYERMETRQKTNMEKNTTSNP